MLVKVASKDTETVINALIRHAGKLPDELYKSLTWDRGKEMFPWVITVSIVYMVFTADGPTANRVPTLSSRCSDSDLKVPCAQETRRAAIVERKLASYGASDALAIRFERNLALHVAVVDGTEYSGHHSGRNGERSVAFTHTVGGKDDRPVRRYSRRQKGGGMGVHGILDAPNGGSDFRLQMPVEGD